MLLFILRIREYTVCVSAYLHSNHVVHYRPQRKARRDLLRRKMFKLIRKSQRQHPGMSADDAFESAQRATLEEQWGTAQREGEDDNDSEEHSAEEWDRHIQLHEHEDVEGQARSKERLFEEHEELPWDKGGSGLVFYTDAQYWDSTLGGFDEKTADDYDVDVNVYKEPTTGTYADRQVMHLHLSGQLDPLQKTLGASMAVSILPTHPRC